MQGFDQDNLSIQTTLPRPWELETTFHDSLYEWMERAPWVAISAAAHLLLFFFLMSIPWDMLEKPVEVVVLNVAPPEPVEAFTPEEEEKLEVKEIEPVSEPELQEEPVEDPLDDSEALDTLAVGDPTDLYESDYEVAENWNDVLGIGGGGPPGRKGNRGFGGPRGVGQSYETKIRAGLEWLAAHQSADGSWDADGFHEQCGEIGATVCGGSGYSTHDVGLTGLALLAFLGMGETINRGEFRSTVSRGMGWLKSQQGEDGLIGDRSSREFLYDHAIATLALCESYYDSKSPQFKRSTQEAVYFLQGARNAYGAWRYDAPAIGESDTSVTGWALFALASARDAGLVVNEGAFIDGLSFLDEVTDPATGRVGYTAMGEMSSRTPANEHFPRERGEALTAVGLLCRVFLGQTPEENPILLKHADLLRRTPPVWDPEGFGCDMYYWYYGTYAMYQMGGKHWKAWQAAMKTAILDSQRKDGDEAGSWDPVGPWGYVGGRVYSTAIMTLSLEVYHRYARVLGAR